MIFLRNVLRNSVSQELHMHFHYLRLSYFNRLEFIEAFQLFLEKLSLKITRRESNMRLYYDQFTTYHGWMQIERSGFSRRPFC
jgi:hypothetical protein